ncbi:unnamed protein product [Calypogeia fissa]
MLMNKSQYQQTGGGVCGKISGQWGEVAGLLQFAIIFLKLADPRASAPLPPLPRPILPTHTGLQLWVEQVGEQNTKQ